MNDAQMTLGKKTCETEIDVLFEVAEKYAAAIESRQNDEAIQEAGELVMAANDIIYKKVVAECGFSFDDAEAFVQTLNLEALKTAHEQAASAS